MIVLLIGGLLAGDGHTRGRSGQPIDLLPGRADTLTDPRALIIAELMEEESAEDMDFGDLIDLSLDLNRATANDLARIPGLSLSAIDSVLSRRRQRRFVSIGELSDIDLPATDRALLRAFTYVADTPTSRPRIRGQSSARWSRRLELARGYTGDTPRYLGSPDRLQVRTSFSVGQHSGAMTFDKPSGARMAWLPQERLYGFDRIHGHVTMRRGRMGRLIVGDFRADYGQGLTVWGGASFGRGREPVRGVMRSSRGLNGTASTMDDRLLRGVALSLQPINGISLDAFASSRRVDAAVDSIFSDAEPITLARRVSRTPHRTELEFDRRNALGEKVIGGAITVSKGSVSLGAVAIRGTYDVALAPGDRPDTRYQAGGREFFHAGLHALARYSHADLFGEVSLDTRRMVAGVRTGSGRDFEAIVSVRNHSARSDNPFAAGFASRAYPLSNERGGYVGLRMRIHEYATILAFADAAHHPWVRYQIPRTTSSTDQFVELKYVPRPWWELSVSVRRRTLDARLTADSIDVVMVRRDFRNAVRVDSRIDVNRTVRMQTRVERNASASSAGPPTNGYLLYHEVSARPIRKADIAARISHFQIGAFDSRIYAYERDVIAAFTTHMYTGTGRRIYALLTYRALQRTSVQLRFARTWLDGVEEVGSGAGTHEGNASTDVSLLLLQRI